MYSKTLSVVKELIVSLSQFFSQALTTMSASLVAVVLMPRSSSVTSASATVGH